MTAFGFATVMADESPPQLAVTVGRRLVPLQDALPAGRAPGCVPDDLLGLLDRWEEWVAAVETALARDCAGHLPWRNESDVRFLPPATHRPTIYCAGANYRDHVAEMGATPPDPAVERPFHFVIPPAALTGHRCHAPRPAGMQRLDWEVELTAVIGRTADRVSVDKALEYVAGYTVANDLSCRDDAALDTPLFGINWLLQKGWRGLKPLGPAIVPASLVPHPENLDIRLSVNGQVRQKSNTSQMIFSLAEQISALSTLAPLHPGDLLLSGTPAGTAAAHQNRYLVPGDLVVAEVEGVGRLETRISAG
ncbi:fumarylacetoacetate hydrolase family protein [Streptomyces sp. NPDC002795]|uniref:fumarylacetoacetate hydrolase family protein n=1 Tax=Streptomyces sp. NPDC002795 TaxID=3364665 RepID=UPI0036CBB1A3